MDSVRVSHLRLAVVACVLAPLSAAQSRQLNGSIPNVRGHLISPDGSRVAFRASGEVYSVPLDASSAPVKLNPPLDTGNFESVQFLAFTPDGARLVFQTISDGSVSGLYAAPAKGGSSALALDGLIHLGTNPFQITADGSHVVYTADHDDDGARELYGVPVDGSLLPIDLAGALVTGGSIQSFQTTPDGASVVYRADQDMDEVTELYVAPVDASAAPLRLSASLVAGGDVESFRIGPDGARVVYRADQAVDERYELWSVPLDASQPPIQVSGTLVANGDVLTAPSTSTLPYLISPDGSRVVYRADQEVDERFELFSAPLTGGASVKLNGPFVPSGDVELGIFAPFEIGSDGARVVYAADQEANFRTELFSVPIGGGSAVKLNAPLPSGGVVSRFQIAPGGARVVYLAEQDVNEQLELFSVPLDRSTAPVQLNAPLPGPVGVPEFQLSPDGQRVAFVALDLFGTMTAGGFGPAQLNAPFVPGGDVQWGFRGSEFRFAPDSRSLVYEADQDVAGVVELYATRVPRLPRRASGPTDLR